MHYHSLIYLSIKVDLLKIKHHSSSNSLEVGLKILAIIFGGLQQQEQLHGCMPTDWRTDYPFVPVILARGTTSRIFSTCPMLLGWQLQQPALSVLVGSLPFPATDFEMMDDNPSEGERGRGEKVH